MSLSKVSLFLETDSNLSSVEVEVIEFLDSVADAIEQLRIKGGGSFRGFVPCDYGQLYMVVREIKENSVACGGDFASGAA